MSSHSRSLDHARSTPSHSAPKNGQAAQLPPRIRSGIRAGGWRVISPAASKADPGAQNQINALKEDAIAREGALKEAKSRVAELEKQIQDMRKLMELKGVTPPGKPSEPVKPAAKPASKSKKKAAAPRTRKKS